MKPTNSDITLQNFSVLGRGSQLSGSFSFQGEGHIFSQIKGDIAMLDDSLLSLERDALVEGNIKCHDLAISGTFVGEINATGTVTLHPSANVDGVINAEQLMIAPGAVANLKAKTSNDDPQNDN